MRPNTLATLDHLEKSEWFTKVGVKDTESAIVLSSWDDTIKSSSQPEWENLCLEAINQLSGRILERSKERYRQWNDVVIELKKTVIPFVKIKIERVSVENKLSKSFEDSVQWDILAVCIEAEYSDVFPPAFYASQAYWYVNGHYPCGWQGDFPNGKLIIY